MKKPSLKDRFLEKVAITPSKKGCWEWLAAKDKDGYGLFTVNRKMKRAHRFSYEFFKGVIGARQASRSEQNALRPRTCFHRRKYVDA